MNQPNYNPDYIQGLFDRMSSSYERINFITSFGFSIWWRKQFIAHLRPSNQAIEVIDLLTGMGETWHATQQQFPNANLTALDFSDGMLQYAKQKSKAKFNNAVTILQQDILSNELPSNYFDYVTCAFGLKTFDTAQLKILAQETQRILKAGGEFTFIEISKPENRLLSLVYEFYLGRIIPILGRLLLGNPDTYKMLWRYTQAFGSAKDAAKIFQNVGLETNFKSYFYGCATGFYGRKF